jgi:predicted Zn-dependent protease
MKKLVLLSLLICIFPNLSQADIIRDSEIEEAINLIAEPIIKASKLKNVKIFLVNDNSLNAFTAGAENIYLFSGMINQFPDIDVIRGVIAHEMGHIIGKHLVRQQENIDLYGKAALSTIAVGLASALSGNSSVGAAIAFSGVHFSERSVLAYSRTFESSADQTALRLLEQSGYSSRGMLKFFEYTNAEHRGALINPYDQTHPLSQERLIALRSSYQNSKFKDAKNSVELEYKFSRSAAKLLAFTVDPRKLVSNINPKLLPEITNYIKSICYFRMGDLAKSIKHIDDLLALKPRDPFYHELKGQVLFEFGKKESLNSYTTALNLRPNDILIKFCKAIVGVTIYSNDPHKMFEFYKDLKLVVDTEPDNLSALYYLAIYYEKTGKKAESLLYSAIMAFKSDDIRRARGLARAAIKSFKPNTPNWYKANDIILTDK